ncbi:MAG: hypothetical protein WBO37_01905, partial [Gammaproteobacteria bacterium]
MAGSAHNGRRTDRRGWLAAFIVAVAAHAGVFQQISHGDSTVRPVDVPPMVTVSLVTTSAAPAPAEPAPQPVVPVITPEPVAAAPAPEPRPAPVKPKQVVKPARPAPR